MVSSVTIQGSTRTPFTIGFDSTTNFALAEQIAAQLNAAIARGALVTAFDTNGTPPAPLPGANGAYVQTTDGLVVLPRGYTTDLVTKTGSAVVFGSGVANETILSDSQTDLTFLASSGSGTVMAGGGSNRLLVSGPGNWSLYTGNGNDIIADLGTGNTTIGGGGGHTAILLGAGNDLVISTGDDTITGGSGSTTIDATGAHSDFVQGHAANLLFIGGAGPVTILGGTGSDTYFGAAYGPTGKQLIAGGSAGNNFLFAGDGAATLIGGGKGDQLFAYGTSSQILIAGAGNETLSAAFSNGNDTLTAGSGKDLLITGGGADTVIGGSGHTTVTAGSGTQVFEFMNHQAGGNELIQGLLDPTAIQIDLLGYGAGAIDAALASQTVKHGSVTIGLTDGTKVTFQDITSLSRSNFI